MSFRISVSGAAADAVATHRARARRRPRRVAASPPRTPTLWGPDAEAEAAKRLGWTEAVAVSRPLVAEIEALRAELEADGVTHIVLAGMGGSSLAPEVITQTARRRRSPCSTRPSPGQVLAALDASRLEPQTALVVSSKSGSTVETDSQRRVYEQAFRDAGIDPRERIIVVTDPGSPLDESARAAGYRVFNADPNVGGRYSALTAFGLVPSGLAGADIAELLDEAETIELSSSRSTAPRTPASCSAPRSPATARRCATSSAIVADGTHIVGFADWVEQLIAESTGKEGTGILPVVLDADSPELEGRACPTCRSCASSTTPATRSSRPRATPGEIRVSAARLGAQLLVWEYATAIAGRMLGINPFDQPDVESAKIAARGLLDARPEPAPRRLRRPTASRCAARPERHRRRERPSLGDRRAPRASCPRTATSRSRHTSTASRTPSSQGIRDSLAADSGRPVDVRLGSALPALDRPVPQGRSRRRRVPADPRAHRRATSRSPSRPFTFGQLIAAQAAGRRERARRRTAARC